MKILITGGAGFIGSHLVKRFELENEVHILDNLGPTSCKKRLSHHKNLFVYDISDYKTYQHIEKDYDLVINSAAETHVDESFIRPMDFIKTNVEGLHLLAKYCADNQIPLIHLSTDEVIGTGKPLFENSMHLPTNPYSATKAAADMLIQSWARTHGLDYIITRPSNNYGKFQYPEKFLPLAVKRLKRGKKIKLHDKGTPIRTWTHVEDTIDAIILLYEKADRNRIYNISSEFEQSNLITAKKIINSLFMGTPNRDIPDFEKHIDTSYKRPGQDVRYALRCDYLKQYGWQPKREFDKEIVNLVKHYTERFIW